MNFKKLACLLLAAVMLCSVMFAVACTGGEEAEQGDTAYVLFAYELLEKMMNSAYEHMLEYAQTTFNIWYYDFKAKTGRTEEILKLADEETDRAGMDAEYKAVQEMYEVFSAMTSEDENAAKIAKTVDERYLEYCDLYSSLTTPDDSMIVREHDSHTERCYNSSFKICYYLVNNMTIYTKNLSDDAKAAAETALSTADEVLEGNGSQRVVLYKNGTFSGIRDELSYAYDLDQDAENRASDLSMRIALSVMNMCFIDVHDALYYSGMTDFDDANAYFTKMYNKIAGSIGHDVIE